MSSDVPDVIAEFFGQSQVPLALTDPNLPDEPLILVNDAFCRLTMFTPAEVIGRNCRFLQRGGSQLAMRQLLRDDFKKGVDTRALFRNFRKNGEAFDNFLFIFHILDENGTLRFRIGSQFEVPMVHKAMALEAHSEVLRKGLELLTSPELSPSASMIKAGEVYGATVKELLRSRLNMLKFHHSA